MQIVFEVNQEAALRRGINAPHSTVKLEIDPATLGDEHRHWLAQAFAKGEASGSFRIQRNGKYYPTEDHVGYGACAEITCNAYIFDHRIALIRPDADGLTEFFAGKEQLVREVDGYKAQQHGAWLVERREKAIAHPYDSDWSDWSEESLCELGEAEQSVRAARRDITEQCQRYISSGEANGQYTGWAIICPDGQRRVGEGEYYSGDALTANGNPDGRAARVTVTVAYVPHWIPADLKQAVEARKTALMLAATESELSRRLAVYQAGQQRQAATAAKNKAEREAMIARLPDLFRARINDGYAESAEVDKAIRKLARSDAGLTHDPYKVSRDLGTLTDDEYAALQRVKETVAAVLPNADVDPMEVADKFGEYRTATENDAPEDVDEDNKVWEDDVALRRRIVITWTVAGLTVKCAVPFAHSA